MRRSRPRSTTCWPRGLDAVMVLTPDYTHAEVGDRMRCAPASPVFCEKPLAITVEDCDRVLETARETGTRLYVGHNMRHLPVVASDARDHRARAASARSRRSGAATSSATAATTTSRTGTPTAPSRPACCCRRAPTTSTSSTGWPAATAQRSSAMGALTVYGDITDRRDRSERADAATGSATTTGRRRR